jgi:hypothetical protein
MADTFTAILNLTKPEVGASTDTWGTKVNADLDTLDGLFQAGPALKLANGGTGATTAAGARTNLGLGSDATGSNLSALTNAATARTNLGLGSDATGSNLSALTNAATARTNLGLGAMATVGSVTLNGDLSGSGTSTISATLANSGVAAGTYTSATVTVDAKGRVTSASSGAGSAPTTAQVLSATAGASVGAVGTYAYCQTVVTSTYAPGATIAGSGLRYAFPAALGNYSCGSYYPSASGASPTYTATVPTGTWRCMGYIGSGFVNTLWLRIS